MSNRFEIFIDDYRTIKKGFTLWINGKIVGSFKDMDTCTKEIHKYLRLRFKEYVK